MKESALDKVVKSLPLKTLVNYAKLYRQDAIRDRREGFIHEALMNEKLAAKCEELIRTRRIQLKRKRTKRALGR